MGKLLIQDLKEFASIKPREKQINLVLDEFNVFASDTIINLINKTRSFNYQCFLCFQTINDLKTNDKDLTDTIFGNTAKYIDKIKIETTKENINPMDQLNKLASFPKSKKYQDNYWNRKLPTMTCPPELVEKFKTEAKKNHWKYTTLMNEILTTWFNESDNS